ncbi:hypothetical protein CALVIDRAFT_560768 [Calocera viscosa TUFC12733]|uniref:Uncharacterized protein n=1 Tax=Calocera viscosa (strain TUFC12733) TaxID=1330018 RepID=A0A167QRP4_CALVF|nr:hypothetical protein CALVIDRAFT_560768 [Calocera viscosa TUFC12733]
MQRNNLKRKRGTHDDDRDGEGLAEPGLQRQILPVARDLRADFDGVPQDGMEYLFTVRRAYAELPWMTSAPSIPAASSVAPAPWVQQAKSIKAKLNRVAPPANVLDDIGEMDGTSRVPSQEWKDMFVAGFRRFRENVQQPTIYVGPTPTPRYPKVTDRARWWTFITDREEPFAAGKSQSTTASDLPAETIKTEPSLDYAPEELSTERMESPVLTLSAAAHESGTLPTTALLRSLDQKGILHLLMYFGHWLNTALHPPAPSPPPYPTSPFEPALPPIFAQWIFALLGHLDDRLMSGEIHTLRTLARACREVLVKSWEIGEAVALAIGEGVEERAVREREREACWIVIAAVADVWGQSDLWEDARDAVQAISKG